MTSFLSSKSSLFYGLLGRLIGRRICGEAGMPIVYMTTFTFTFCSGFYQDNLFISLLCTLSIKCVLVLDRGKPPLGRPFWSSFEVTSFAMVNGKNSYSSTTSLLDLSRNLLMLWVCRVRPLCDFCSFDLELAIGLSLKPNSWVSVAFDPPFTKFKLFNGEYLNLVCVEIFLGSG